VGGTKLKKTKAKENGTHNLTGTFRRLGTWFYSHTVCIPVNTCRIILDLTKKDGNQSFDLVKICTVLFRTGTNLKLNFNFSIQNKFRVT